MKAREIIRVSCSDQTLASILLRALETAGEKIAQNFGEDATAAERARQKLAAILLAMPVSDPPSDPEDLAEQALEAMALQRRRR
jgi:hypothetical protein